MNASIVITTKNRKEELRAALRSAFGQSAQPEVVVMDDGSTDGTAEMVRMEFPKAVLRHFKDSKGYIVRRNEGAQLSAGRVVFSIDDDAEFSTPNVIEQTLLDFDDPRIGAVAIPFVEPRKSAAVQHRAPASEGVFITDDFIGTSHAVRRDLFLQLGGYKEFLIHQGEEMDFCIRMLEAGYVVRLGRADVVRHLESPRRSFQRMDFFGTRNSILFAWHNAPWPYLPVNILMTTINCICWTFEPRRLCVRLRGIGQGFVDFMRAERKPVHLDTFKLWRELRKKGPLSFGDVRARLDAKLASS